VNAAPLEVRRAALVERYPILAKAFAQGAGTHFEAMLEGGVPVDLRMDGRPLYGGDARHFSARQVAAYQEKPLRLYMDRLDNAGLVSPVCIRLVSALKQHLLAAEQDTLSAYPIDHPTFLVVFGLGLGHHLEPLVQHVKPRWLILVEPLLGVFEHSLAGVDWPRLIGGLEAEGGGVHVVTASEPSEIAAAIARLMDVQGIAFADGSWIFTHYPFWAFEEARKRLHEAVEFAFVNRGFFEDELRMMTNAVGNFGSRAYRLLEAKPHLARAEAAVIVGAGPSLDESFETLRRIRSRVLLFSCGTSLRPLLRNGLIPDFHCELENVPEVHDLISEAASHGDLSKVALIASATVDPRVPPFFGPTLFFFRGRVSSTEILGRTYRPLPGVSPTCVNVGLAAATYMGCQKVILFGTDCGVRRGTARHAEGTIYRDVGIWQERDRAKRNAIEVEGNFGGVIETDWVYDACRRMLSQVVVQHPIEAINCSDGALIPGARSCTPEALDVKGPEVDRGAVMRALDVALRRFGPGEVLMGQDFVALAAEVGRLFADLDRRLVEARPEMDFAALYLRLKAFTAPGADQYSGCLSIVSGTLSALPRIAMFYGYRIVDRALRCSLYECCVEEMRAVVDTMAVATQEMVAEAAARVAVLPRAGKV
jgi:hypothetical protein